MVAETRVRRTTRLRRIAGGIAAFVGLAIAGKACSDLTAPIGVNDVTVDFRLAAGQTRLDLIVGDSVRPAVAVMLGGIETSRAKYVFTSSDPSIIRVYAGGDSIVAEDRGTATLVVTLVGSTIGNNRASATSRTADTILVAAAALSNQVTPATVQFTSISARDTLYAFSLGRNNKVVKGTAITWRSTNPAAVTVTAVSDSSAEVVASGNGSADVWAVFGGVDSTSSTVNVSQTLKRYLLTTPTSANLRSINETMAILPQPVDSLGNPLGAGAPAPPAPSFLSDNPGKVEVNPTSGVMTARGNTTEPVRMTATVGGVIRSDTLQVTVTQVAASLAIQSADTIRLLSVGDRVQNVGVLAPDALGTQVPSSSITWTSLDPTRVQVVGNALATITAQATGTVLVYARADLQADTVVVVVTNDPATVTLAPKPLELRSLDETQTMTATVTNTAGNPLTGVTVTWTSRDSSIVQPQPTPGVMLARAVGETRIVVSTPNGRIDSTLVRVTNAPDTVRIIPDDITLASAGDTDGTFAVDFKNARGVTLLRTAANWSSHDVTIARAIDGVITAVAPGVTYIVAVSPENSARRDSVRVTVTNAASTVTVTPDPAATLTALGATTQFSAVVRNAANNVIPGATVVWSVPVGSTFVTIDPVSGVATATGNGTATIRATSGTVFDEVTLTVAQAVSTTQSTVTPASTGLVADGASNTVVTVQLEDANGNPITTGGATVTLGISPAIATLSGVTDNGNGTYTATLTAGTTSGTVTISANVNGSALASTGVVNLSAAAATQYVLTVTPSLAPVAGSAVTISARLADANGNSVATAGNVVTWSSTGGGSFGAPTSTTDATGVATVSFTTSATATPHTVTGTTGALTGTSPVINPTSGAATHFAVVPASFSPIAGSGVQVTAQLQDANNNAVRLVGQTVTWTKSDANGAFSAPTSTTDANGVATITLTTHTVAGTATTVTATSAGPLAGTSATITTSAGTATQLTFTQAPTATPQSGVPFPAQPTIQLRDALGNPVTAANVSVTATLTSGTGAVVGTTSVLTNGSGLATFTDLAVSGATGAKTLTFTASGIGSIPAGITLAAGPAAQISVQAGNGQSATVGTNVATAPSVLVRDASGNPVAGVDVTFSVTAGGGTTSPASGSAVTTDAAGLASLTTWTLGTSAGSNTVEATVTALTLAGEPVVFTATATVGVATTITALSATTQSGTVATAVSAPPSVLVQDANSNPVSGFSVTFSLTASGGTGGSISSPATVLTNAAGIATLSSWTLGQTAGTNNNTVTATGAGLATITFNASGTAGAAQNILATSSVAQSGTVGAAVVAPAVRVRDSFNNPVSGVSVSFALTASGGTGGAISPASPAIVATDANGDAALTSWTLGQTAGTGNNVVTATVNGLTGSPVTFTASSAPDVAATLVANSSVVQTATVGTAVAAPPSVIVRDQFGNAVGAGINVSFTLTAAGGTGGAIDPASVATVATNGSGVATLNAWTLGQTAGTSNNTVTATIPTLNTVTFNASGAPGVASNITAQSVTSQSAIVGTAVAAPSVLVRDASNNPIAGFAVTFTVTATGGVGGAISPASPATVLTDAAGVATLTSWTIGQSAGTNNNTVTATGSGLATIVFNASGTPGAAASLVANSVTSQSATVGATAAPPSVIVRDQYSNAVGAGVNVTFTLTATGGTGGAIVPASVATVATDASGVATLTTWTLGNTAGSNNNTVTATIPTLNTVTFNASGTAGTATTIAAQSATSQGATVATAVAAPPSVLVTDANGNPVSGFSVTFTLTATGGTGGAIGPVSPATVVTNASGVATLASWTVGQTAGTNNNTVTATGTGLATITFNASGTAGAAQNIIANTATSQSATVASSVTAPSVIVRDAFNNPVSGMTVTFTLTATGGTGGAISPASPASVMTDAAGIAALTTWTLGQSAGSNNNTVTAAVAGLTGSPVTFTASGTSTVPAILVANSVTAQSATVATTVAAPPSVVVRDQFGNPVGAGVNVTFTLTATGGTGGTIDPASPATVATNAFGVATLTSWTLGQTAALNNNTVTATIPTLNTVTFDATGTTAAPSQLVITTQPSATAVAGVPFTQQPVVQVQDAFGNLATTNSSTLVTATRAAGTGSLMGTLSATAVNGVVTFTNLAHNTGSTITIQFTSTGLTSATSTNVVVSGPVKYLVSAARSTVAAGDTVTIFAQLADVADNHVALSGKTVTWSRTGAGGSFAAPTSVTDATGQASVILTVHTAATTVHTVTATDNTLLTGTSGAINVVAAAPSQLVFVVQPNDAQANAAITPSIEVEVRDAFGNPVLTDPDGGATETISLAFTSGTNTEGATLGGTLSQNISWGAGRATFADISANLAGDYALAATEGGFAVALTDGSSASFNVPTTTATISASTNVAESDLNNGTITVQIANGAFGATPAPADFTLNGEPAGVSIAGVTRNSATEVVLALDFDGTDFDTDQVVTVDVLASALASGTPATTGNSVTFTPDAATSVALTGPSNVAINTLSGVFTLEAREANGTSMTTTANAVFNLSHDSPGIATLFASDGITPTTTVTIATGTATITFFYQDNTASAPASRTVTATWASGGPDLLSANHLIVVDP